MTPSRAAPVLVAILVVASGWAGVAAPGSDSFRIRLGQTEDVLKRYVLGNDPRTQSIAFPARVTRFRGDDRRSVLFDCLIEDGDPADWVVACDPGPLPLGPAPVPSRADSDRDGDVDETDRARFDACVSGDGTIYPLGAGCVAFDSDNDLDVDDADQVAFEAAYTGPLAEPFVIEQTIVVALAPGASPAASLRLRVRATDTSSGETHAAFARIDRRPHRPLLEMREAIDFTVDRRTKLVFDTSASFDLRVTEQGADTGEVTLSAGPSPAGTGFEFSFSPSATFSIQPLGFDPSDNIPWIERPTLTVNASAWWPRRSRETITVEARSLGDPAAVSTLDLTLIKAGPLWTPSDLLARDGRRHLVVPGRITTFGLLLTNIFVTPKTFTLLPRPLGDPSGWVLTLSASTVTLDPGAQAEVIATLAAPPGAAPGTISDWSVTLTDLATFYNVSRLGGVASGLRKTVFFAVDGLQPEYLSLDARGAAPGRPGDWLMPNARALLHESTSWENALAPLPSLTDPNHVNALAGTTSGGAGIPYVRTVFYGHDADGGVVARPGDASVLRTGSDGAEVLTAFDVVKQVEPRALTAIATGKNWIADYFVKPGGGADRILNGRTFPLYIAPPQPYVLGDPPGDADADGDPPRKTTFYVEWGNHPGAFPDDRFILRGALRLIEWEDPDVLYILLGGMDNAQHQMGTAWNLAEWDGRGTGTTWDDVSRINPLASREEVLDVAREVDTLLGELITFLKTRGTLDDAYVALLADHGMVTETPPSIDLRIPLQRAGFGYNDAFLAHSGVNVGVLYDVAPEHREAVETILEEAPPLGPGLQSNPWVVLNREEMKTGIDARTGRRIAAPGELYSEFYTGHEIEAPERTRWPTHYVFFDAPWQSAGMQMLLDDAAVPLEFIGGHGGVDTRRIPLALRGPGVPRGRVSAGSASLADLAPTIYFLQGWPAPEGVQGMVLPGLIEELPAGTCVADEGIAYCWRASPGVRPARPAGGRDRLE